MRVLDFLLENRFWDYSPTEIARETGVSRQYLARRIWPRLLELELVKPTRRIGRATLYRANMKSPILRKTSELSLEIATQMNQRLLQEGQRRETKEIPIQR